MAQRKVNLVGSIGLADAAAVFSSLGSLLGERAERYPDGETGARGYWIRWLNEIFSAHPQFEPAQSKVKIEGFKDKVERTTYRPAAGVSSKALDLGRFGYAACAIESYAKFKEAKLDGTIPANTRFQVALPTPVAVVSGFVALAARSDVEPAAELALSGEVAEICAAIPAAELAIQWDVCHEVVAHDGGPPLHYGDTLSGSVGRVCRLVDLIPADVEVGIHLCYGDPGHQHIVEPTDLGTCVAFANEICAGVSRSVNWMHMPVPKGRTDTDYFNALADLELQPNTELYLGLVHMTDGLEGAKSRINAATKTLDDFGIATECGFGRRDPNTIADLLKLHAEIADWSALARD